MSERELHGDKKEGEKEPVQKSFFKVNLKVIKTKSYQLNY